MQEILAKVRLDNGELQADVQDAKKIVDTGITEIEKNSIDLKVDAKSTESLRTQMRKAQQEVAELSARFGATSKAAVEAAKRAAELRDRIGDAKALTDAFNPDAKFKALTGSLQGVVGGFTAVQGAIGAFGVKNEEVEQALLKVNSAMALSQGLQSVGESVDSFKQLGAVIKSTTAFQFLYNAATSTATAVQSAFGVATTVTTTGFKLLRAAIISTGIGALVVGLGMVIANFDSISAWIKSSPLAGFANQVGNLVQRFTDFIGVTSESERSLDRLTKANARANESLNSRIKILKAQGGSEKEVYKLSQQVIENNLNDIRNAAKVKGTLSQEEAKKIRELKVEELVLTAEYNKKISDDNKKAGEKAEENRKKANEQAIKDEKTKNDEIIKQRDRLIAQVNKPQEAKKAEIDTLTARGASKEEIAKANEELLQLEIDYANKVNIIRSDANQKLTAKFKENIDARDKEIVAQFEENKKITELEIVLENKKIENKIAASQLVNEGIVKELQNKKQLLSETETLNDKEKQNKETQLLDIEALILQSQNRILQLKIDAAIKAGAAENGELVKGLREQLKTNEELIDKNQRDINKNTKKNQEQAIQEQKDRTKKALLEIADFAQNGILLQIGLNPQDVDRVKKTVEDFIKTLNDKDAKPGEAAAKGAEAAQMAYQTVSSAIFAADSQRRQEELAALQVQQEEELRLAGDNEQKKDLIKQKYALKEREIKRRQAEADKRKAILDATVNTAVAVIKTFATMGFPAGIVGAAIVAALGAAQIALIAAQPIPKFEKGGAVPSSDINGIISGRPHAAGGVLIEAEGNEFITRRSQAIKGDNLGLLEAINMSDSERDAYINRHYVMPALQAKESQAAQNYRSSIIEAENNLIARVSSSTLKSIDRRLVETNQSIKGLAKKDYTW